MKSLRLDANGDLTNDVIDGPAVVEQRVRNAIATHFGEVQNKWGVLDSEFGFDIQSASNPSRTRREMRRTVNAIDGATAADVEVNQQGRFSNVTVTVAIDGADTDRVFQGRFR
jgi:hypothetical protein